MSQFDAFASYYEILMGDNGDLPNHYLLDPLLLPLFPKEYRLFVLDAGCGSGRWTKVLSTKYKKIIGIDISEGMLDIAKKKRSGKKIIYKQAELGKLLPFADSSFDFIFSNMVMHYVGNIKKTARELYRVLKSGSSLLFSTQHETFDLARYDFLQGVTKRIEFETKSLKDKVILKRYFEPIVPFIKHFTDAGFIMEVQKEAIISQDFIKIYPKYEKHIGLPRFLVLKFKK